MRVTMKDSDQEDCCSFIEDLPDGNCLVELPSGMQMSTGDMGSWDEPYIAPETGREVFYPGWCEW